MKYPIFADVATCREFLSSLDEKELRSWDQICVAIIYNPTEQDRWKARVKAGNHKRLEESRQGMIRNAWSSRHLIFQELVERGLEKPTMTTKGGQ